MALGPLIRLSLTALIWGLLAGAGFAQIQRPQPDNFPLQQEFLPIASLNRERLLTDSDFGKALVGQLDARQRVLVEENNRLQQELEQEELQLTDLRKTLAPEEFKPLAEAFDTKVKSIRRVQEDKAVQLTKALENARFVFFRRTEVIIVNIMRERGIRFLLNEQAVLLSTGDADITNDVLEELDRLFAAGVLTLE